jgi:hypothetical protein
MRWLWMLSILTCCAPVPPVRDHVERTLATAARWQGPGTSVVWFGDGCYFVRADFWGASSEHLVRATTDVLPAGELVWAKEPPDGASYEPYVAPWPDPGMVLAGRGRGADGYDAFLLELNEHRCQARWNVAFEVPPVEIEVRDHGETPFSDTGLEITRSITLSRYAQLAACVDGVQSAHVTAYVCVEHGVPRILEEDAQHDIANDLSAALERATARREPRARCASVDLAIPSIACHWNVPHRSI